MTLHAMLRGGTFRKRLASLASLNRKMMACISLLKRCGLLAASWWIPESGWWNAFAWTFSAFRFLPQVLLYCTLMYIIQYYTTLGEVVQYFMVERCACRPCRCRPRTKLLKEVGSPACQKAYVLGCFPNGKTDQNNIKKLAFFSCTKGTWNIFPCLTWLIFPPWCSLGCKCLVQWGPSPVGGGHLPLWLRHSDGCSARQGLGLY